MLERVQIHGLVEVRYRDRVAVTDGTQATSPLFANGNTSPTQTVGADGTVTARAGTNADFNNNRGQFVRDANGLPTKFNSPAEANLTIDDLLPFRVHANLSVDAMLTDGITLKYNAPGKLDTENSFNWLN